MRQIVSIVATAACVALASTVVAQERPVPSMDGVNAQALNVSDMLNIAQLARVMASVGLDIPTITERIPAASALKEAASDKPSESHAKGTIKKMAEMAKPLKMVADVVLQQKFNVKIKF